MSIARCKTCFTNTRVPTLVGGFAILSRRDRVATPLSPMRPCQLGGSGWLVLGGAGGFHHSGIQVCGRRLGFLASRALDISPHGTRDKQNETRAWYASTSTQGAPKRVASSSTSLICQVCEIQFYEHFPTTQLVRIMNKKFGVSNRLSCVILF